MAAEAVVSVVSQKLTEMLKEEWLTQSKVIICEVEEITKSLNSMRDLMTSRKVTKQLAEEYLEAVYNVEDQIEKFALDVVRQKKTFGFLMNHLFFFNNLNSCQKIQQKIKKITTQLKMIKHHECYRNTLNDEFLIEDAVRNHKTITKPLSTQVSPSTPQRQAASPGSYKKGLSFSYSCNEEEMQIVGIKEERLQQPKHMSSFSYKEEELGIFGFNEDVNTLVKQLVNNSEHVLSIVGQGGIGKTTLARAIYRNSDIKRHFQLRAWVSVLEEYTIKDILQTLSEASDNTTEKAANVADEKATKLKLSTYLKNKRYLVILDGVSTCNIWKAMKETFPDVKNGSKLVLTSSQTLETTQMSLVSHYMMPLSEDDSWNMFRKKVGEVQSWALVPEKLKQTILQSCKGLPLNIVLLAGLFSMKDAHSWSQVFACAQSPINLLLLCYNDLSDHLKVCLLYTVLFPKGFDIPVRRLLRLWLAEGFVKQQTTELFPEDIAQTYFEELVNRNMIQISKLRSDNSPRRCRVLGVLHDYLLPKAQETNLFSFYHNGVSCEVGGPLNGRRMVEYESKIELRSKGNHRREVTEIENVAYPSFSNYPSPFTLGGNKTKKQFGIEMFKLSSTEKTQPEKLLFSPSHLRSYLSFNFQKKDHMQAKQIGSFLGNIINSGSGLLRVLDLEGVYKPILPQNLGNLCNLRYLGLRRTFLDSLPSSVGELTHLQTLDVKHTCIDELPDSIWRLKNLHHLNLNEMCLNMELHSSLSLLTLWGLFLNEKFPIKNGFDKLQHLRELGITFHLSSNQVDLMDWIAKLRALQSLKLRSKDNMGRPSKLIFRSMSNLGQLSHLNLLGHLEKLPDQNEFPPTLKVLTLSISLLKRDPMGTLGQLPCLTVLRLLGQSYVGKEMVCRKGGFSKLRILKMWMLKELETWFVEEGSMPSLKHLDIRCCDRLHDIPTTLLQQENLEELVLTGMPHTFTTEVECLKSDHTSMTVNHWISSITLAAETS